MKRLWWRVLTLCFLGVAVVLWWTAPSTVASPEDLTLLSFDKDEMVRVAVSRPDLSFVLEEREGTWRFADRPYRPAASMVRRIGHQLHSLTARSRIAEPGDLSLYGLADPIRVEVGLRDGTRLQLEIGSPTPSPASGYVRVRGDVYTVQSAALGFWRAPLPEWREDRFIVFDAALVQAVEVDDRRFLREDIGFRMVAPIEQPADRQRLRALLGRISALRSVHFASPCISDPVLCGLDDPEHVVTIMLPDRRVTLHVGAVVPADPEKRYVTIPSESTVYVVKGGFVDELRRPVADFRDRDVVGEDPAKVDGVRVVLDGISVAVNREGKEWHLPGGALAPAEEVDRLVREASGARATAFLASPVTPHRGEVVLTLGQRTRVVRLHTEEMRVDDQAYGVSPSLLDSARSLVVAVKQRED